MSSGYKVGDKFVIEIGHGTVDPLYGAKYFIKGFSTLVFDDYGLDCLEQVNGGPTLRDAYDEGFERGLEVGRNEKDCKARMDADAKANADYNAGYEDGLRDAWECARKIVLLKDDGGISTRDYKEALGTQKFEYEIFRDMPVSEVLPKLKEYEAKQNEIKIGDEVRVDNQNCVVLMLDAAGGYRLLREDGDIKRILEQTRGANNETD